MCRTPIRVRLILNLLPFPSPLPTAGGAKMQFESIIVLAQLAANWPGARRKTRPPNSEQHVVAVATFRLIPIDFAKSSGERRGQVWAPICSARVAAAELDQDERLITFRQLAPAELGSGRNWFLYQF